MATPEVLERRLDEALEEIAQIKASMGKVTALAKLVEGTGLEAMAWGNIMRFGADRYQLDDFGITYVVPTSGVDKPPALYFAPSYLARDISEWAHVSAISAVVNALNNRLHVGSYLAPTWGSSQVSGADKAEIQFSADDSIETSAWFLAYRNGGNPERARIRALARDVSARLSFDGMIDFGVALTPPTITAAQNDYDPANQGFYTFFRLSSDASRNITGWAPEIADHRVIILHNIGANNIVFVDESASSTAANRFALSGNLTLAPDQCVLLQYDNTTDRWRCIGTSGVIAGLYEAAGAVTTHAAAADPHTGYRLESADHTHQSTGLQAGTLDHGLALTGLLDDDHTQYTLTTEFDAHTGDASDAHDASAISVLDSGGYYAATDLEAALAEHIFKRKTADETVNNTSTVQNDDHLSFAIGASEVWAFTLFLRYDSATATPDFKCAFTVPTGASGAKYMHYVGTTGSVSADSDNSITSEIVGTSTTDTAIIVIHGVVVNSTTAGTVQFQWAQNTATAENTTLFTNSWLMARRIA